MTANLAQLASLLSQTGKELTEISHRLKSIETLSDETRQEAIAIAKEILEKLKLMASQEKPQDVSASIVHASTTEVELLRKLAHAYHQQLQAAASISPELLQDGRVIEANEAINICAYLVMQQAAELYQHEHMSFQAEQMQLGIALMPSQWKNPKRKTLRQLMEEIHTALKLTLSRVEATQAAQGQLAPSNADQSLRQQAKPGMTLSPSQSQQTEAGKKQIKENIKLQMDDKYLLMLQQRQQQTINHEMDVVFRPGATIKAATIGAAASAVQKPQTSRHQDMAPETDIPGTPVAGRHAGPTPASQQQVSQRQKSAEAMAIEQRIAEERLRQQRQQQRQQQQRRARDQQRRQQQQRIDQADRAADRQTSLQPNKLASQTALSKPGPAFSATATSPVRTGPPPSMESLLKQAKINLGNLGAKGPASIDHHDIGSLKPTSDLPEKPINPDQRKR